MLGAIATIVLARVGVAVPIAVTIAEPVHAFVVTARSDRRRRRTGRRRRRRRRFRRRWRRQRRVRGRWSLEPKAHVHLTQATNAGCKCQCQCAEPEDRRRDLERTAAGGAALSGFIALLLKQAHAGHLQTKGQEDSQKAKSTQDLRSACDRRGRPRVRMSVKKRTVIAQKREEIGRVGKGVHVGA